MTEKRISLLEVHFEYLSSKFRNQQDEMSAVKTQLNNAISTIQTQESLISNLQTRLSSGFTKMQNKLETKISALRDQIETIHSTLRTQQETQVYTSNEPPELNILTLQSQMETLISTSHAKMESQISYLQNEVQNTKSDIDVQLQTKSQASYDQLEPSCLLNMLEKKISDLKVQLETTISKSNSLICILENRMVSKSSDLQTLIETLRSTSQEQTTAQCSTLQKDLENKICDIHTKLETIHSVCHFKSYPLEKKLDNLQTEIETIRPTRVDQLDIKISTLRNDLERTTSRLQEQLSDDKTVVAFTAGLDHILGGLNFGQIVLFQDVVTNISEAYNPDTGVFLCPITGLYHFSWTIFSIDGTSVDTELHVSGNIKLSTYSTGTAFNSSTASGVIHLKEGEDVCVKIGSWGEGVSKIGDYFSSFSGHLIRKI